MQTKAQITKARKKLYADMLETSPLKGVDQEPRQEPRQRLPRRLIDAIAGRGAGEEFDCPACPPIRGYRRSCHICLNHRTLAVCGDCNGTGWDVKQEACKGCEGMGCIAVTHA